MKRYRGIQLGQRMAWGVPIWSEPWKSDQQPGDGGGFQEAKSLSQTPATSFSARRLAEHFRRREGLMSALYLLLPGVGYVTAARGAASLLSSGLSVGWIVGGGRRHHTILVIAAG
jgi:hypothetical protein